MVQLSSRTYLRQVRRRDEGSALAAGSTVVLPEVEQVPHKGHMAARRYPPHGNLCQGRAACLRPPAGQSLDRTVHANKRPLLCVPHMTGTWDGNCTGRC